MDKLSEFKETNFAGIAREMGAWGVRVTDPKDIGNAVRHAIDADMPAVVDVVIDQAAVGPMAFMAGQGSRGSALTASGKEKRL